MTATSFWQRVRDAYNAGVAHAFLLHGNVTDYVPTEHGGWVSLPVFLRAALARFDLVAQLDMARGLTFPTPSHAALAATILAPPAGSPAAMILAAADPNAAPSGRLLPVTRETIAMVTQIMDVLLTHPWATGHGEASRPGRMAIILWDANLIVPEGDLRGADAAILARLIQWARDPRIAERQHLIIAVSEMLTAVHADLRRGSSRWEALRIPLPPAAMRREFAANLLQQYGGLAGDPDVIARMTGGLPVLGIEDIALTALERDGQITPELVGERKAALIAQEYGDVLRLVEPQVSFADVAGYAYLTEWLAARVVRPWRTTRALPIGGLLLSGPPGTGKTLLAEALAGEAGVPFVVFDLSRILGSYVGQSERALERALEAVLALAPCVLFIDELDQVTGRGTGGDGGSRVDNRVFARLLTFLESRSRRESGVLPIGATNRPDLLDDALRSRFDRSAPVLPPTAADRAAILTLLLTRVAPGQPVSAATLHQAVAQTDGWTGRNLRDLATIIAEGVAEGAPIDDAVAAALACYRPPLRDTAAATALALAEVTDLRLLPEEYRAQVRTAAALPPGPGAGDPAPHLAPTGDLPAAGRDRRARRTGGAL